jgi:hypothetical protein
MYTNMAAAANSRLETAGGDGSFIASNSPDSPPPADTGKKKRKRGPVSERQRQANIANAAKSTGPRTDDGKARSLLNAFQHGIYAEAAVLPGEDECELELLKGELADDYQPRGAIEKMLVGRLASISWKLRRLARAEEDLGNRSRFKRKENYDGQIQMAKMFPLAARPPSSVPADESEGHQIFADDFRENGKPGRLQQITQLEMKLTGQLLAVTRQLVQMRKLAMAEEKQGFDRGFEEGAGRAAESFDEIISPARNEPIREAKAQAAAVPFPKQSAAARNEPIRVPSFNVGRLAKAIAAASPKAEC